jgi:DinB superfamily
VSTFDLIASGYRMGCQLVHSMCADLTPEEFQRQPLPGTNSAAWIVGHLALTAKRTAERLGATGVPQVSDDFVARFKATRQQAGNQTELGSKSELLALLDAAIEKLMEAIKVLPPESLTGSAPTTAPPFVKNSGDMMLFGAMHITLHCGQLSTIRRSLGKPPLV